MSDPRLDEPAEHATDFALRWADRLENSTEGRMHALGIPEGQIGSSDHAHGVSWRTFFPHERAGGNVTVDGRINVDSGVLNPELLDEPYGEHAGRIWASSRLSDRIDAIIVHEEAEHATGSHEAALKIAPGTARPISDGSRRILRTMESDWKGRS